MEKERNIFTFAFEGMHRTGKSTVINKLKEKINDVGIPCISIRGEGYRSGEGDSESNPESDYWKRMKEVLQDKNDYKSWNEASYRLARELLVWRDRVLLRKIDKSLNPFGVLLVDRSLVSKAVLKKLEKGEGEDLKKEDLYPESLQVRKKINLEMLLPDIIFEFIAPKAVLLERLDSNDPDFDFRKKNIEEKYDLYLDAKKGLPEEIRERIVTIDSSGAVEETYTKVLKVLQDKYPELKFSDRGK